MEKTISIKPLVLNNKKGVIKYMKEKKIYFIGKTTVDGKTIQTERIDKIIDPETEKPIFEEAFSITEYADIEKYKDKDDFIMNLLSVVYFVLKWGDEIESVITVNAIEEGTDTCKWGIRMEILDNEKFQYEIFDYVTTRHSL